jgi:Transposase family tnp2
LGNCFPDPALKNKYSKPFGNLAKDIWRMWDAGHLCKILLKKRERFLPGPANETRPAFSFSMDSFNLYHIKEAKQSVSSTAIWLIVLNLPPYLQYHPENMFLASIISGPKKLSLSDINHSLKPLVDVLLEFFDLESCNLEW